MSHSEFELKLGVPARLATALATAMRRAGASLHRLQAHYIDTPQGTLARCGAALRVRREDDRWVQTLKALRPGPGGGLHRFEHNVELPATGRRVPGADLARHAVTEEGARLHQRVLADSAGAGPAALHEVCATRVQRLTLPVTLPDGRVEVALDRGELLGGAHRHAVVELEFELLDGPPALVFALAEDWMNRHPGLWIDVVAKSRRAAWTATGSPFGPAVKSQLPDALPAHDAQAFLQRVVDSALQQVLGNASEIAHGSKAEEHVHQMRVGLRRLRTVLRELGSLSSRIDAAWEPVLARAQRDLGQGRDRTILEATIQPALAGAGAPLTRPVAVDSPALDPAAVVTAQDLQRTLLGLLAFVHTNAPTPLRSPSRTVRPVPLLPADVLAKRLRELHRKVTRAADAFARLPLQSQHRVRKRLKRLRYLAEFAQPLYPDRRVARYLAALTPAQDMLGCHNDEAVALQQFRHAARTDPLAWFAVGWLTARLAASGKRGGKSLRRIRRAKVFWRD